MKPILLASLVMACSVNIANAGALCPPDSCNPYNNCMDGCPNGDPVHGNASVWAGESEPCRFDDAIPQARERAQWNCAFYVGSSWKAVDLTITRQWEAFPNVCHQDGSCGKQHECIVDW